MFNPVLYCPILILMSSGKSVQLRHSDGTEHGDADSKVYTDAVAGV